jgi:hypothetical protein
MCVHAARSALWRSTDVPGAFHAGAIVIDSLILRPERLGAQNVSSIVMRGKCQVLPGKMHETCHFISSFETAEDWISMTSKLSATRNVWSAAVLQAKMKVTELVCALACGETGQPRTQARRLLLPLHITVCAPRTKSFRRYLFPRLLVPVSCCLPPLECSPGTTPNQAANPRPFLKAAPLPMAAMVAVAITGPMPGIAIRRRQGSSSLAPAPNQPYTWLLFRGSRDCLG